MVELAVPVSTHELERALQDAGVSAGTVTHTNNMSVTKVEGGSPDLYQIFEQFRQTNIWPALLAEGKYKYHSAEEWLDISEVVVSL